MGNSFECNKGIGILGVVNLNQGVCSQVSASFRGVVS
jgi:hypothetical protein